MSSTAGFLFLLSLVSQSFAAPAPVTLQPRTTNSTFASTYSVDISGTGPSYSGDGSTADGWPSDSAWLAFEDL